MSATGAMYDDYYSRLINDDSNFYPRDGNEVIRIYGHEPPPRRTLEETSVIEQDILSSFSNLHSIHERKPLLQVLLCSPEKHESDAQILPLSISRASFESLRVEWKLPTEFLRMMLSTMPIATKFSNDSEGDVVFKGLMIRGGRSRDWNYCVGIVHDSKNKTTNAIIHGLESHEHEIFKKCLRQSLELAHHPILLAIILIELKIHHFAILLERRAKGLDEIEYETGMRHGFSNNPIRNPSRDVRQKCRENLDFDLITQKLTGLAGTFAFCDLTFQAGLESLSLVKQVAQRCPIADVSESQGRGSAMPPELERRVEYLEGLIAGSQHTRRLLQQRTQAQVQTVYSLIGQKDAEAGLRDSKAMRFIAGETKEVAVLTRRDSTDMRTIALVTLTFLPGTFTATVFSMGFFNFSDNHQSLVVSPWVWLYCVISVGLTVLVILTWVVLSRRENKSTYRRFSNGSIC